MWTANVSSSWLAGFTVCLSLIVSIGAQNLYVLRQAVQGQHVRACVAWCVVSDVVLIGLGVAGMGRLLGGNRSGERRGGEEGRSRGAPGHLKKKKKHEILLICHVKNNVVYRARAQQYSISTTESLQRSIHPS